MILVDIDVAKDKHDCFIMNLDGEMLAKSFTFANTKEGFNFFYERLCSVSASLDSYLINVFPPYNSLNIFENFCTKIFMSYFFDFTTANLAILFRNSLSNISNFNDL